jgi:hypothetical protein
VSYSLTDWRIRTIPGINTGLSIAGSTVQARGREGGWGRREGGREGEGDMFQYF